MRNGGEESLAPVIPLFGARGTARSEHPHVDDPRAREERARAALADAENTVRERSGEPAAGSATERDTRSEHGPIRHLRAVPTRIPVSDTPHDSVDDHNDGDAGNEPDAAQLREQAEEALVRKLRAKQLSVSEARSVLRQSDLDRDGIEEVIDEFERRGYLDDSTLASLLVTSAVERKGQGRVAIARSLAQRGIPREVIDDALSELPDDDEERALDFARTKANGMRGLEYDTALRRLLGQLARRGYGGSSAMSAARTALDETGVTRSGARFTPRTSGRVSGVRFTDSD